MDIFDLPSRRAFAALSADDQAAWHNALCVGGAAVTFDAKRLAMHGDEPAAG